MPSPPPFRDPRREPPYAKLEPQNPSGGDPSGGWGRSGGLSPGGSGQHGAASKQQSLWAGLAHFSALASYLIPFGNFAGPLIVWWLKKDAMPFVDDQGKEALNFQITLLIIAAAVAITLCTPIGFVLASLLAVYAVVMSIIAGIKASQGIAFRYPFTLRLIK